MHDIDRTQLEEEEGALERDGSGEFGEFVSEGGEAPLNENLELQLASELLEVTSEQELDRFLGNVFKTVGSAVGQFARSDTGRALGGILKDAARQALPVVGSAVGRWISPERGGAIGADVATQAGRIFGLELEGLSAEDREFEVARQFVRFASAATQQATAAPPTVPPMEAARMAASTAARAYAPGLFPRLQGRSGGRWPRSGRWVRRGRAIVLYGG